MPTFDYFGHKLTIDHLYSYARVSSPQQLAENGGEGISRQVELAEEFSDTYGIPLDPLADLGKSGSPARPSKPVPPSPRSCNWR